MFKGFMMLLNKYDNGLIVEVENTVSTLNMSAGIVSIN